MHVLHVWNPMTIMMHSVYCDVINHFFLIKTTCIHFILSIHRGGSVKAVKYLIEEKNCIVGCTDNNGYTPLHWVCW